MINIMKKQNTKGITKLNNRKQELIQRTSEIFNITEAEAIELFNNKKSTISVIKETENTKKLIEDGLTNNKLEKISWTNNAYIIKEDKSFFTHTKEFENGEIYIQNASSLIPVITLEPKSNELILDMCAAPGGKTINIYKHSENNANIIVNDENSTRVNGMKKLFEIYSVKINAYYSQPAQYLSKHLPYEYFDKILLDAPCSGEGLINLNDEKTLGFWSTKKIKRLNNLQKNIIAEAYKLLKPGGTLVYSTCTLAPEENEDVVSWTLDNFKDLHMEEITLKENITNATNGLVKWKDKQFNTECSKCLRVKPNEYMEAFFVCKLKKQ